MMDTQIKVYGTPWCGDTRRARTIFGDENIPYEWIDISTDAEAAAFVERVNNGYRSVPTIVFPDGAILVEPPSTVLIEKLRAWR
jgi:glutaredoxin-like protein